MKDPKAFLKFARMNAPSRPAEEISRDYRETRLPRPAGAAEAQSSRCMDCGTPFCNWGCPAGSHTPEWNAYTQSGQREKACRILQSTNCFPEFTGRLCPAPCEESCVLGTDYSPVTIRDNELDLIERAFEEGIIKPEPPSVRTGRKIAVIGSGPAGLSAASALNKSGHSVTVFEKRDKIGGLLRYGIPDFKLEKGILDRRLRVLEAEGIIFRTGAAVGKAVDIDGLRREYNALCLATGCEIPRDLNVQGRSLKGIYFAMDYLSQSNRRVSGAAIPGGDLIDAGGKKVVIIGGGDTGADCAGTALRQNAKEIVQVELLPRPNDHGQDNHRESGRPSPGTPAGTGGISRLWGVLTESFAGDRGRVKKIYCAKAERGPEFKKVPGSEFEIAADMVILALGFTSSDGRGIADSGISFDRRGLLLTDGSFAASKKGVFAAGDARRGPSLIVHAITEGRECARSINSALESKTG